jgi:hypothetical protein
MHSTCTLHRRPHNADASSTNTHCLKVATLDCCSGRMPGTDDAAHDTSTKSVSSPLGIALIQSISSLKPFLQAHRQRNVYLNRQPSEESMHILQQHVGSHP